MNTAILTGIWFVVGIALGAVHGFILGHLVGWLGARNTFSPDEAGSNE